MTIKKKAGLIYYGSNLTRFEPRDLNVMLPDDVLFRLALADASDNAGGHIHSMGRNGKVCRYQNNGNVCIEGEGWRIEYKTDAYIAEFKRLKDAQDWPAFAELTKGAAITEFNKVNKVAKK